MHYSSFPAKTRAEQRVDSKKLGHCWSKGLDHFVSIKLTSRGSGLRGCAKLWSKAAEQRISWIFCRAEKQGGRKLCRWR